MGWTPVQRELLSRQSRRFFFASEAVCGQVLFFPPERGWVRGRGQERK